MTGADSSEFWELILGRPFVRCYFVSLGSDGNALKLWLASYNSFNDSHFGAGISEDQSWKSGPCLVISFGKLGKTGNLSV